MTVPHYPPRHEKPAAPPPPPPPPGDIEVEDAPPPDPKSLRGMFEIPAIRNYLFAGLGAVAMIFAFMLTQNSDIGGLLIVLLGASGMILRWPAAPPFVLLFLLWFLVFPFGLPPADENYFELDEGRFRIGDILFSFSVVVYLAAHYRVYGLTKQAVPFEQRFPRKGDKPLRRPTGLVASSELPRLLYLVGGVVIVGQIAWLLATTLEVDALASFPFRIAERQRFRLRDEDALPPGFTRFLLVVGMLFFGTLLARLVLGYWRMRQMNPTEAGMVLLDAGWDETRRERTRVEKWRAKGKAKAEQAK